MKYLPDAKQMKRCDQYTIEELGIPSVELMERAAKSCVEIMVRERMDLSDVCVVCGSGNNGGDGFAVARFLHEIGKNVKAIFVGDLSSCTEETLRQKSLFEEAGGMVGNSFEGGEYSVIVDAIFGVGLNRKVEGIYARVIEEINNSRGKKLAVDIPSGISASSGSVLGTAVCADVTITFQCPKIGMILYPGHTCCGTIHETDIGIDLSPLDTDMDAACTYECCDLKKLLPKRYPDSHKGTYGKALIIAGSKGMAGAAYLNALAAYRAGAGLVQIYTPEENRVILQQLLPEAVVCAYDLFDEREILSLLRWANVVCIGSGIGTSEKAKKILRTVLENTEIPCVADADALNLLAEHMKYLKRLPHNRFIFTPHMKEMSRIVKKDIPELKQEKMEVLRKFTSEYPVTCILKDTRTVVACEGKHPYVNLSGNPAMAKAGAGDVLAGIITGLLAQKMECLDAAQLGVYLHGLAGDSARTHIGSYSVLARELAEHISVAMDGQGDECYEGI